MSTDGPSCPGAAPSVRGCCERVAGNELLHATAREGAVSVAAFLPAEATADEIAAVRARIVSQLDKAANQRQRGGQHNGGAADG